MADTQVDYDRIAPTFDQRYAVSGEIDATTEALLSLAQSLGAARVLEVGCGTGHWLARLQPAVPQLYGLDLSAGMLQQARWRPGPLNLVRGRGGRLPFADAAFDLVVCIHAIHHFDEQRAFVSEARRLLRPGGALAVFGLEPRNLRKRWYIYDYFEGTCETDMRRFPFWGTVLDWMIAAGFARVTWRPVTRIVDHKVGREVLDDPFLRKDQCSQLALLTDEAYAAGRRRIEAAIAKAEATGETCVFQADFSLDLLVGHVAKG